MSSPFALAAQLLSTPSEKAVPAHQSAGTLSLARGELVFAADGHTRAPVALRVADIARRQPARPRARARARACVTSYATRLLPSPSSQPRP